MVAIQTDLNRFYDLLAFLRQRIGGEHYLFSCTGRMDWPRQGVYFFFEQGEKRSSSTELRVVRVGTHAVSAGSKTTLWDRLRTHRGSPSGGGNHRGSIFRLHVGSALLARGNYPVTVQNSWGKGSSASKAVRLAEHELECHVSEYIGKMPFIWLRVEDEAGPESLRKYIERNSIALLSTATRERLDIPSPNWLGFYCKHKAVRESGLWNVDHIFADYDPAFLDTLERLVREM